MPWLVRSIDVLDNIESYICRDVVGALRRPAFRPDHLARNLRLLLFLERGAGDLHVRLVRLLRGQLRREAIRAQPRDLPVQQVLPKKVANAIEGIADLFWIAFNVYFVYLSYNFVFFKMNLFWKSQTLGIPMKYIYVILPIAFTLDDHPHHPGELPEARQGRRCASTRRKRKSRR